MWIPTTVALTAVAMIGVEQARPARRWPRVPGWTLRALALTFAQGAIVLAAGLTWDPWLLRHRPWSADGLGLFGGAALGYLAITFVYYFWHRARHEVPFLWRWVHQLHHSPQRLETITSFYKHPVELVLNGVLSSFVLYVLVGLSLAPAALAVLLTGVAELFYHWNVRTPHWLGYLVQRPESHCRHHEDAGQPLNYSDLPLWDWLFGTLDNPRAWHGACGFGADEARLPEMLRGVDLTQEDAR